MEGLRKWLKIRDVRAQELAYAVGVKAPQISKWMSGVTSPTFDNAIKVADFLQVSLDALAGREVYSVADGTERRLLEMFRSLSAEDRGRVVGFVEAVASESAAQKKNQTAG